MTATDLSMPIAADAKPASQSTLSLAWRFALREMRGGLRGFYVFLACIALGVAAIAGVNSVALSITGGIASEGKAILGGDLAFSLVHREASENESAFIDGLGKVSQVATLRAMARKSDGSDQTLIEIKAVDANYPLEGSLITEPSAGSTSLAAQNTEITVDPLLLDRLELKVGDKVKIGSQEFLIGSTIGNEPDRVGDGFAVGPKVLMSIADLRQSGLVQLGSLVRWRYRVAMNDTSEAALKAAIETARDDFPNAGWRVQSRSNAAPALARNIERFSQFLTLVGLTALIVGGVGVANAVRAFMNTKQHIIATFKCLGAPANLIFQTYLIQILLLTSIGVVVGLVLGMLMPVVAKLALAGIIPVSGGGTIFPMALLMAVVYGFLTALAFTLWPLGRARDVPATALFRQISRGLSGAPARVFVLATGLIVLVLTVLAVTQAADSRVAGVFVAGIAFSFVLLRAVAQFIEWLARKAPQVRSTPLRLAIGNIHRPGALTPSVVLSLGLGLALLVALAMIDGNLRRQVSGNLPERAPDFFFVDIQNAELDRFKQIVTTKDPDGDLQSVPMLRGRITALNGVSTTELKITGEGAWVLRGDRGITYSAQKPENSSLESGKWWAEDYSGSPLVSFTAEEAGELGLKVGDTVTVNVLGRTFTAEIANLRNVEWESMSINFVMVFSPNTFAGAPHSHLATLRMTRPEGGSRNSDPVIPDSDMLKLVTQSFPTVTSVRVRDAASTVNELISQLATAIRAAASVALVASILVLGGALAAGNESRTHDAVVLKTLGATRKTLIGAFATEYFLLGLATAIFALFAGGLASWFVIDQIMGFEARFMPEVAVFTIVTALVFTVGFGLAGTWRVLGQKAAPILRDL
ncbi:MAG: ABC transporter permease [Pseudomonadota bacterium]